MAFCRATRPPAPPATRGRFDLGATGKALGADRAAVAAIASFDGVGGVLVSLGGDIRVAGEPPIGGGPSS